MNVRLIGALATLMAGMAALSGVANAAPGAEGNRWQYQIDQAARSAAATWRGPDARQQLRERDRLDYGSGGGEQYRYRHQHRYQHQAPQGGMPGRSRAGLPGGGPGGGGRR